MKPEDCELVAHVCAARAGLKVDPEKAYLMESRLAPVARRDGFASIGDMLQALRAQREERLISAVVEAMAMGETSFFRDRDPFIHFRDEALPALASARGGEPVRVWSAACASGQEVYSLAMMVEQQRPQLGGARVDLFASDISERALEKAPSGLYTQFEVQRGLPIRALVEHFEPAKDMWILSPRVRQMVRWRRVNLIADLSGLGQFDVIACRYVLNGLLEPMRQRVLDSLAAALRPDGYLYLGQDEAAHALSPALQPAGAPGVFARRSDVSVAA